MRRLIASAAAAIFLGPNAGAVAADSTWQPALAGYHYAFPRDFGAHASFQNEWWYYTGNVADAAGRRYGFELTFFRTGIQRPLAASSAWDINDLYAAHFAVTDGAARGFHFFERSGRAALHFAGASAGDENVWIGTWRARRQPNGAHLLRAGDGTTSIALSARPAKPLAIQGRNGVSRKGSCSSCASHYYSFTRLAVTGTLSLDGRKSAVSGYAWNDHEWGSNELQAGVVGWDWFSLQLDNQTEVMLYLLRRRDGSAIAQSSGTIVRPGGRVDFLPRARFSVSNLSSWRSPHSGARYPAGWRIELPGERSQLWMRPLVADQELITNKSTGVAYWEGACRVAGTFHGQSVGGFGYTELTGY